MYSVKVYLKINSKSIKNQGNILEKKPVKYLSFNTIAEF